MGHQAFACLLRPCERCAQTVSRCITSCSAHVRDGCQVSGMTRLLAQLAVEFSLTSVAVVLPPLQALPFVAGCVGTDVDWITHAPQSTVTGRFFWSMKFQLQVPIRGWRELLFSIAATDWGVARRISGYRSVTINEVSWSKKGQKGLRQRREKVEKWRNNNDRRRRRVREEMMHENMRIDLCFQVLDPQKAVTKAQSQCAVYERRKAGHRCGSLSGISMTQGSFPPVLGSAFPTSRFVRGRSSSSLCVSEVCNRDVKIRFPRHPHPPQQTSVSAATHAP